MVQNVYDVEETGDDGEVLFLDWYGSLDPDFGQLVQKQHGQTGQDDDPVAAAHVRTGRRGSRHGIPSALACNGSRSGDDRDPFPDFRRKSSTGRIFHHELFPCLWLAPGFLSARLRPEPSPVADRKSVV